METFDEARETIFRELTSDDSDVRTEFLRRFGPQVGAFSEAMGRAVIVWRSMDDDLKGDTKRAYVSALVFAAINLHILSMKLFVSGHTVAAGNLSRQVVETIALAILCSEPKGGILDRFMHDAYSANDAVRDVLRRSEKLGLKPDGVAALKRARDFYHKYSHLTKMTLADIVSFSQEEGVHPGACFDKGKLDGYTKEIEGRLSLARVFPNVVAGIKSNVAKWCSPNPAMETDAKRQRGSSPKR